MTELPSLEHAPWLANPQVKAIFELLNREGEVGRAIGGAVRDSLLGRQVTDVDFATTATPDWVMAEATKAGMKAVPTGIEHGTVTLVADGRGFEVTTLREDIATDGRRAVVRFGRNWSADAQRRDFTINALSVDADGTVLDPIGGYSDILAGRVRFIGDPDRRIAEDRLRILRLFRFHAECGKGQLDRSGLEAAIRGRNGLRQLAAERVSRELQRLLLADAAAETVTTMQDAGVLQLVLGGVGHLGRFRRLIAFEQRAGLSPTFARRLAALAAPIIEDAERITARLRLSNADRDSIAQAVLQAGRWRTGIPSTIHAKEAVYRAGWQVFVDSFALAAANSGDVDGDWAKRLKSIADWGPPAFPIGGKDLIRAGVIRGPGIGELLRELEAWWIDRDFIPDRTAILSRVQQILASRQ